MPVQACLIDGINELIGEIKVRVATACSGFVCQLLLLLMISVQSEGPSPYSPKSASELSSFFEEVLRRDALLWRL